LQFGFLNIDYVFDLLQVQQQGLDADHVLVLDEAFECGDLDVLLYVELFGDFAMAHLNQFAQVGAYDEGVDFLLGIHTLLDLVQELVRLEVQDLLLQTQFLQVATLTVRILFPGV